ncbi:hypothetical protein LBO01_14910 [Companilactobacillus paralimentarius]|nr:hypothetical protein LBO01_14910 [Companilactobacillus paralimentarius]
MIEVGIKVGTIIGAPATINAAATALPTYLIFLSIIALPIYILLVLALSKNLFYTFLDNLIIKK